MFKLTYLVHLLVFFPLLFSLPVYGDDHPVSGQKDETTGTGEARNAKKLYTPLTGRNPFTGSRLLYLPSGDLYPPYAADPVRVCFAIQPVRVVQSSIKDASNDRINLRAGGHVGLVRSQLPEDPGLGWQLSLLGGFNDQNDVQYSLDNIGWDGRYGLVFTIAYRKDLAFKLALLHVSSHLGDEYIERTGRKRISYTRQEAAAGASWFMTERWRIYAEAGKALTMSNDELQEPWRGQAGLEYESAPVFWSKRMAWYAALDTQSFQERDWRVDLSFQTGFVIHSEGQAWRLGAEWYSGRPPIGEFFQDTDRYISIGVWIDI